MSDDYDRLGDVLKRLVLGYVKRLELFGVFGAKLITQLADLTFETKPDDATIPGDTKVPYLVGLPGFKVKVPAGVRGAVAFLHGSRTLPATPTVVGFEAGGGVTEVAFDGGTKSVARVDDSVSCGTLLVVTSGGSVTAITYVPPGSPIVIPPGGVAITLVGKIDANGVKLKA